MSISMDIAKIFCGIPAPGTEDFEALVAFCENNEPLVLASISSITAEFASAFGFREALTLIRQYGGGRVYLSKTRIASTPIKNPESLERLLLALEGLGEISLPSATGTMDAIRRVAVGIEIARGESTVRVCRRYGISTRAVRHKLNTKGIPFIAGATAGTGKTPGECYPGYAGCHLQSVLETAHTPLQNHFNVDPVAEA